MRSLIRRQVSILLIVIWFSPALADLSTLDYLYSSGVPGSAQQIADRAAIQIVNDELENARSSIEQLKVLLARAEDPGVRTRLLLNYGALLVAMGDLSEGTAALSEGVGALETIEGEMSAELVEGLVALGIGLLSFGDVVEGEEALLRAQNLLHRHAGVYSPDQQIVLYYLTMMALNRADFITADRLQRFSLLVAERSYGEDSPLIVPTLTRLGAYFASRGSMLPTVSLGEMRPQHGFLGAQLCAWTVRSTPRPCNPGIEKWQDAQLEQSREASKLHTTREDFFSESIAYYERATEIQKANQDDFASSRFDTLRTMAKVYIQQGDYRDAEQLLFRATEMAELEEAVELEDRIEVALDLGDLLTVRSDKRATAAYLTAWRLLQESGPDGELYFQKPRRLVPGAYQSLALDEVPDSEPGERGYFALVTYDVSEKGRVEDIRVIEANVPGAQIRSLRMELLRSRFRPRIEAGQVVETRDMQIRFTYVLPG